MECFLSASHSFKCLQKSYKVFQNLLRWVDKLERDNRIKWPKTQALSSNRDFTTYHLYHLGQVINLSVHSFLNCKLGIIITPILGIL